MKKWIGELVEDESRHGSLSRQHSSLNGEEKEIGNL